MKTSELRDIALNWAVAKALGHDDYGDAIPDYSTNWEHGGPIIEREKIGLFFDIACGNQWRAHKRKFDDTLAETPLIAAMRCFVASRLGDEVQLPEEAGMEALDNLLKLIVAAGGSGVIELVRAIEAATIEKCAKDIESNYGAEYDFIARDLRELKAEPSGCLEWKKSCTTK